MNGPQNNHLCSREISNADNPDPEMVVPSSALLDPWGDSYSGESRKTVEEQEERELNQIQRRQGQRFGGSLSVYLSYSVCFRESILENYLVLVIIKTIFQ